MTLLRDCVDALLADDDVLELVELALIGVVLIVLWLLLGAL